MAQVEGTRSLVASSQIKHATLHNPIPLQGRVYIWPFIIIWPVFFAFFFQPALYAVYIGGPEWTFVFTGTIITLQALGWLVTKWNVTIDALFTTTSALTVSSATLIKMHPIENAGPSEIVPIQRDNIGGRNNIWFTFQKRRFQFDHEEGIFMPLQYPLDAEPKPLLAEFQQCQGLRTEKEVKDAQEYYGDNTFDIPVPTFTELWKEHAVAPFFVFQIFCVGLWLLDEYWKYSLFTLFMLVMFESTVVWQRQKTLNEFRAMSIEPYDIYVYREKKWTQITSDKLLPGDLVSVNRTKEDGGVACDMVMVEGTAIVNEAMLSGESTPLLKDSVALRPKDAEIEPEGFDKNAFLYGGTKVLQVTHGVGNEDPSGAPPALPAGVTPPPDGGALAVIVRTGFETSQGSLVRTMIYSTERVSANNAEALWFILFLLVFAIAASWYVWTHGVEQNRKRSKLLLDCILIITSVVPPELPMELSLAVNTSLAALGKFAIFCTEPFRIPYAGRVDVACFDKTGTLTGENLVVDGIAGLGLHEVSKEMLEKDGGDKRITNVKEVDLQTTFVLATAHALVKLDEGDIVGDPMEKATLEALGWELDKGDILYDKYGVKWGGNADNARQSVQIKRRFQFSSALKRQSSVAVISQKANRTKATFVGVKGAPETIRTMLTEVPPHYEATFKYFTRNGGRVLALAYKYLSQESEVPQKKINDLKREDVESSLTFAGFLILQCPLKPDAHEAVRMLNESSHRVVMITGDNPLTAVHVAKQVEIVDRETVILDAPEHDKSGKALCWRTIEDATIATVDPTKPLDMTLIKDRDLCVTGYALNMIGDGPAFKQILRYAWVYARVSPKQKEEILLGLKNLGYTTLMCGDGTNDVGALKQAHVGVALLNGSKKDLDRIAEFRRIENMKKVYEGQVKILQRWKGAPPPPVPVAIAHLYPRGPTNPHWEKAMAREAEKRGLGADNPLNPGHDEKAITPAPAPTPVTDVVKKDAPPATAAEARKRQVAERAAAAADSWSQKMLAQELEDENEPPQIKLGDASVAAPFTSKLANVIAIPNIIRQGRCTLVATIQMYKILALNCLISAYSLSVLYLEGIKFGDGQVTISGMLMSVCFLSISRAKSVEGLSKERPQPYIFNIYIIGSILGQFAIHIATLIYISNYVARTEPRKIVDVDDGSEFEPSLLNSAVYLLQLIQQVSTFAINYQGRPFRESISENKGMFWGIVLVGGVAFSCATEFVPELNEHLKLVKFDNDFKINMTVVMLVDYIGCWVIENVLKTLFSDFRPKDIAIRRPEQLKIEADRKYNEYLAGEREKEIRAGKR